MNIVLFLNKDIEANLAYTLLKKELLQHTVTIYFSDTVGNLNTKPTDLLILEHYEKAFVFNDLMTFLRETNIDNNFAFFEDTFTSFPIQKCANINTPEFIEEIKTLKPDLFISIRFGKIFKDEIIRVPKHGLLNLHSAILPNYRGIMGTLHTIKDKNTQIGCTLHTIPNSGIDTGEIIEIAKMKVSPNRSLFWHILQLYPLGATLIIKALKELANGKPLKSKQQNLDEGAYFSVPTQKDFEQVKNMGFKIISKKDYIEILTQLVIIDATAKEKQLITEFIEHSKIGKYTS